MGAKASTVITRFVARRTVRSATVWAYVFGAYVAAKSIGYAKAYPTDAARLKIAHSFGNNIGLNVLLGQPHHLETISGFAAWNTLSIVTIIGSIWALLLATKYFRGEETAGRTELLLSGPTTARQAALSVLTGLGSSLLILYVVTAAIFAAVGHLHLVGYSVTNGLFFALGCVAGAAMFLAIGALASQLMPTRSRASSLAAIIFGLSFLIRAMGDVTNAHWLLTITPLGWIEKLQPLAGSQPFWLLPIIATIAICIGLTVWLAGRRDLGDSVIADRDSAKPHLRLLNSPLLAEIRLTRGASLGWLIGTAFIAAFYGLLSKSAVQAFAQAGAIRQSFNRLEHASQTSLTELFLGIVFFILMALVMLYTANAVGKVREDEAEGYVENFLVRPVSRTQWLGGRILLVILFSSVMCLLAALGVWLGQLNQASGVGLHTFLLAGLNMVAPVSFTLGAGIFALGFVPRHTSLVAYGVIGWSFLISMISSGVNLSHWILDTSILHQVSLAPAAPANWHTNLVIMAAAAFLAISGVIVFNRRDLQAE